VRVTTGTGARALAIGAAVWVAALLAAPLAIASSQRAASVGAAIVYAAGARVCHQRPERCFRIGGRAMPVCARCTGLYAGAAIAGAAALAAASARSGRRARRIALLAALPTLATWSVEAAGLAHPSNSVRAIAALPLGFAAAWLVIGTLNGESGREDRRDRDVPAGPPPRRGRMQ
jgi:uncharacterized membrane protein